MEQQLKPIHLACGDDELRPNMQLIQIKNNIASATNGTVLVKINLTQNAAFLEEDSLKILEGKYIHKDVWKEIHKCDKLEFFEESIDCWKNGNKRTFYYSSANGEFFSIDTVISNTALAGEEPKRIITMNPKLITVLSKIFQHESLTFSFSKGNGGMFVFPNDTDGMFALLMPMQSDNLNRYYFN